MLMGGFSCTATESDSSTNADTTLSASGAATLSRESVMGVWTDGSGPNATFVISSDSIEYVDVEGNNQFMYELVQDSIVIYYEDFEFRAQIKTGKDTLIFEEDENTSIFTRFRE